MATSAVPSHRNRLLWLDRRDLSTASCACAAWRTSAPGSAGVEASGGFGSTSRTECIRQAAKASIQELPERAAVTLGGGDVLSPPGLVCHHPAGDRALGPSPPLGEGELPTARQASLLTPPARRGQGLPYSLAEVTVWLPLGLAKGVGGAGHSFGREVQLE